MIPAAEALKRLQAGNTRFVADRPRTSAITNQTRREELVTGQSPFAVILGCSDSRVPAEVVFDQGLGDLFVVRVAGNITAPSQVESVEFAAGQLGVRLVVVLGHSHCGAIQATLQAMTRPASDCSPSPRSIVDRIRPALEPILAADRELDADALVEQAVRANIRAGVARLRDDSDTLRNLIAEDGLQIVGAEYALESGEVEFFGDLPRES